MHLAGFKSTQDDVSQGPTIRVMIDRIELYGLADQVVVFTCYSHVFTEAICGNVHGKKGTIGTRLGPQWTKEDWSCPCRFRTASDWGSDFL